MLLSVLTVFTINLRRKLEPEDAGRLSRLSLAGVSIGRDPSGARTGDRDRQTASAMVLGLREGACSSRSRLYAAFVSMMNKSRSMAAIDIV